MNNGDTPAFPFEGGANNGQQPYDGLTKREYFAGLALQGLLAGKYTFTGGDDPVTGAIEYADALLKALGES